MADEHRKSTAHLRSSVLGAIAGALAALVLLAILGLAIVYSGAYNVAATEDHTSLFRWAFDTTFRNSVEGRAEDVRSPERLTPDMVAAGATVYKSMCEHCHSGPGAERAEWASGMRPRPPHLAEKAAHWEPREVFWLVKHGVKMTGMPAFGPTHDDATLWNVAAFVKELPAMTAERYAALGGESERQSGHTDGAQTR